MSERLETPADPRGKPGRPRRDFEQMWRASANREVFAGEGRHDLRTNPNRAFGVSALGSRRVAVAGEGTISRHAESQGNPVKSWVNSKRPAGTYPLL